VDSLFQCLACLHEASDETVEVVSKVVGVNKQNLVVLSDEDNDGGRQLRPDLLSAMLTLLRDGRIKAHGTSANAAVFGVLVPIKQLMAFAGFQIVILQQFVVALPKGTHLISLRAGDGVVDTVCLVAIDIHHRSPRLEVSRRFHRYLTVTVRHSF